METEQTAVPARRSRRKYIVIALGLSVLLCSAGLLLWRPWGQAPSSSVEQPVETTAPSAPTKIDLYQEYFAIYSWGLSPERTVTIKTGDSVAWINKSRTDRQIVSDTGPVTFKGQAPLKNSDMYLVTFTTAGSYTFHDTTDPTFKGTVIVE